METREQVTTEQDDIVRNNPPWIGFSSRFWYRLPHADELASFDRGSQARRHLSFLADVHLSGILGRAPVSRGCCNTGDGADLGESVACFRHSSGSGERRSKLVELRNGNRIPRPIYFSADCLGCGCDIAHLAGGKSLPHREGCAGGCASSSRSGDARAGCIHSRTFTGTSGSCESGQKRPCSNSVIGLGFRQPFSTIGSTSCSSRSARSAQPLSSIFRS